MRVNIKKIKVLCITSTYKLSQQDNIAYFIAGLNKILQQQGIDVTVLAPHGPNISRFNVYDGVKIFRFSYFFPTKLQKVAYHYGILSNINKSYFALFQFPFLIFFLSINLIKLIRRNNYSVIHAHWLIPQGCIAVIIGKILKKPTVITIHGSDIRKIPKCFSKFFLKQSNVVICPHPELSIILNAISVNFEEIPNIVRSPSKIKDSNEIFKQFGLIQKPVISFIARLDTFKDPVTLIKSVPSVMNKNSSIQFVIAGDGPLFSEVTSEVSKIANKKRIKILGMIDNPDTLLGISTVFVALSRIENIWSTSLVEAMKTGIACIVTKSGTTEMYLTHMENAYLIDPNSPDQLADAILFLIDNPNFREQIAEGGKKLISKTFLSEEKIAEKIINIYSGLSSP